jgi:hypothetical protein
VRIKSRRSFDYRGKFRCVFSAIWGDFGVFLSGFLGFWGVFGCF